VGLILGSVRSCSHGPARRPPPGVGLLASDPRPRLGDGGDGPRQVSGPLGGTAHGRGGLSTFFLAPVSRIPGIAWLSLWAVLTFSRGTAGTSPAPA
jgi:hypothetical protein